MANSQLPEMAWLHNLAMTALEHGGALAVSEHADWLRSIRRSPGTIEDRVRLLILLSTFLGQLDSPRTLLDATAHDLYLWQLSLGSMAANSVATYIAHIKGFYSWRAKYHGAANAGDLLVRPTLPRRLPRPIEDDSLREAFALAEGGVRVMLFLMAFCGARCGEVAHAERSHLRDRADPPKAILYGKGGKERVVPMPHGTGLVLDKWAVPSRGHIVRGQFGRPLCPNRVSQIVNGYLHSIGIPDTAHSIRHWYGTNIYRITKDIRLVQEMMGHASPGTTAIYTQYDPVNVDAMTTALDGRLAQMLGGVPQADVPDSRRLRLLR